MPQLPAAGSGTIKPALGSTLSYQGQVAFDTTGTGSLKNPRIWVAAYTPGTTDLLYGEGGADTDTFTLGGGSSKWVELGGGAAACQAQLFYIPNAKGNGEWNGHGAQGAFVVLASCSFDAGP
jgi:hypothetical protein